MIANGFVLGLAALGLAFSGSVWLALLLAVPLGLGGAGFITAFNAITQQECPPEMRARILALTAVAFLGSYPIGGPITGLVGDYASLEWSLAYGAVITLVSVSGLVWWALGRRESESRFEVLRTLLGSSTTDRPEPERTPADHMCSILERVLWAVARYSPFSFLILSREMPARERGRPLSGLRCRTGGMKSGWLASWARICLIATLRPRDGCVPRRHE